MDKRRAIIFGSAGAGIVCGLFFELGRFVGRSEGEARLAANIYIEGRFEGSEPYGPVIACKEPNQADHGYYTCAIDGRTQTPWASMSWDYGLDGRRPVYTNDQGERWLGKRPE